MFVWNLLPTIRGKPTQLQFVYNPWRWVCLACTIYNGLTGHQIASPRAGEFGLADSRESTHWHITMLPRGLERKLNRRSSNIRTQLRRNGLARCQCLRWAKRGAEGMLDLLAQNTSSVVLNLFLGAPTIQHFIPLT